MTADQAKGNLARALNDLVIAKEWTPRKAALKQVVLSIESLIEAMVAKK